MLASITAWTYLLYPQFKFISPQKIIVGLPDKAGTKVYHYLEKISKLCEKSGYEVIRVPAPEGFDHRLPGGDKTHTALYANSLMMNKRINADEMYGR